MTEYKGFEIPETAEEALDRIETIPPVQIPSLRVKQVNGTVRIAIPFDVEYLSQNPDKFDKMIDIVKECIDRYEESNPS